MQVLQVNYFKNKGVENMVLFQPNEGLNVARIKGLFSLHSLLLCAVFCFMAVFLILPICYLFFQAFINESGEFMGLKNFSTYLLQDSILTSLYNTFFVSTLATIVSVGFALLCAYALARTHCFGKKLIYTIALLPLFVPSLMYGLGLVYLLGNKGIITTLLELESFSIYGAGGIIIAQSIYIFPQSFLVLYLALQNVDNRLYEQAEMMGISALQTFLHITLPGIRFGLLSACMIGFILCFTDFGTPIVIGGQFDVVSVYIYKYIIGQQNFSLGATIAIALLFPALVAFFVLKYAQKHSEISAKATPYVIKPNKIRDRIFSALALIPLGSILIVMLAVALASIIKQYPYDLSLTLEHFAIKSNIDGLSTLLNSFLIALMTAIFGCFFSFVFVYLSHTSSSKIAQNAAHFLMILPSALPGLVLGLGYVMFFNKGEFEIAKNLYLLNPFYLLYGTFTIIMFCHIIHYFSIPSLSIKQAMQKIDSDLESMGKVMGISRFAMFKSVYFPLCLPALLENFMYFFLNAMVSISAVIFLYTASNKVAAITIVNLDEKGYIAEAAALTILIVAINFGAKILFEILKKCAIARI